MLILIAGLVLFLGVHSVSVVAAGWRDDAMARLGEAPWKLLYALIAVIGFALIVFGYGLVRSDPVKSCYTFPRLGCGMFRCC